ncbi:MAG: cation:proton antiporter [Spirochaetia bacterium]|nr:cation:proton antiporter [Spirochaetota bacterium]MDW8111847.1 cation:proton antiporter [Spirochaetia bacterium]
MPHIDATTGLFLVFLISSVLLYLLGRFEIPFIVSLIIAGLILGQFGLLGENEIFREIADFGVMLMLFFVGVEFSIRTLWSYRKEVAIIGVGQIVLTFLPSFALLAYIFNDVRVSFILSSVITMSSTIAILSLVEKKSAIGIRYGRISFLVALIQDITSIIILVILSLITTRTDISSNLFLGLLVFTLYSVALYYFTKTKFADVLIVRDRYLIVFLAIVISFGSAVVAKLCGLSPFLGAFVAGMIISDSFFGRQIASEVLPIKEIFVGFFFIYIGSTIKIELLVQNILSTILVSVAVMFFKFLVMFLLLLFRKESIEHNLRASVLLSNMGEFGLLILSLSLSSKIITETTFIIFSSAIVISIVITSFMFHLMDKISNRVPILRIGKVGYSLGDFEVVIVGFGPVGKRVAEVLNTMNISNIILEMNSDTVRKHKNEFNIHFGDAKRENILRWAGIEKAKLLVITAPILNEALFISEKARAINPNIDILARVKFISEVEILKQNNILNVVCDETSALESLIKLLSQKV